MNKNKKLNILQFNLKNWKNHWNFLSFNNSNEGTAEVILKRNRDKKI